MGVSRLTLPWKHWRFLLDASAIIELLGPVQSSDHQVGRHRMQPAKLTQLARNGLVWVVQEAIDETAKGSDVAAEWVRANRKLTQPDLFGNWEPRQDPVLELTSHLPGFQRSPSDMAGLCTALSFNENARTNGDQTRLSIVVRDDQYEAACFASGVTAITPAAYVLTFASLKLPN